MDDLQGVRDISDRDELEAQFTSAVERAHVADVRASVVEPAPAPVEDHGTVQIMIDQIAGQAATEAAAEAERRSAHMLRIRGLARSVVSEVAALAGQDPCNHHPVLTVIADNLEAQLRNVYDAKPVEQPRSFRHASGDADLRHAHAVSRAIVGAQG